MDEVHLLACFTIYIQMYGIGVNENWPGDQGHFMYYKVGPLLISYGLLDRARDRSKFSDRNDKIVISENGRKFYQLLNLYRSYNNENISEW